MSNAGARREVTPGGVGEVFWLAYPVVLSSLTETLMGVFDTFLMGKVSIAAQGAVGLGSILVWSMFAFFAGSLEGVNTFTSQRVGEGRHTEAGVYVWHGIYLALFSGCAMFLLHPLLGLSLRWIGTNAEVAPLTLAYAEIRLLIGGGLFFLSSTIIAFLRGTGNTRTPMKVTLLVVTLNVPLSWWFIFGGWGVSAMGARGAAFGTVMAQGVGTCIYMFIFFSGEIHRRYGTRRLIWSWTSMRQLLRVSLPIGIQWLLDVGAWTIFTAYVSRWGKVPLAAHQIVVQLLHLSFMPGIALGISATTLVGQYIGKQRRDLARRSGYSAIKIAVCYMGCVGLLFWLFGRVLTGWFNPNTEVIEIGSKLFSIAALFQVFDAIGMASSGALRGAGDTKFAMYTAFFASWCVFIPAVFVFGDGMGFGMYGAWFGAVLYVMFLSAVLFTRWVRGKWEELRL